jgi:hypothetical protein
MVVDARRIEYVLDYGVIARCEPRINSMARVLLFAWIAFLIVNCWRRPVAM